MPVNINLDIDTKLVETFYYNNMYQILNIKNSHNKYLDLCFTNRDYNFQLFEADDNIHLFSNPYYHKGIILNFYCIEQKCSTNLNFNLKLSYDFIKQILIKLMKLYPLLIGKFY